MGGGAGTGERVEDDGVFVCRYGEYPV